MQKLILVLAPHTDDGEFGCGGTLARLIEEGNEIVYVAFSAAEQSVLPQFPKDILRTEVQDAAKVLGIKPEHCIVHKFAVRRFNEVRQDILELMVEINGQFQPDIVFLPSLHDTHQDHQVIAQEGFRAFKKTTLMGYEIPWNNLDFRTSCFFALELPHVDQKIRALACYKSQTHRAYAQEEYIRSLMMTRGIQIGKSYAEAFEVIRLVY